MERTGTCRRGTGALIRAGLLCGVLAGLAGPGGAQASNVILGGVNASEHTQYGYVGAIVPMGHELEEDGLRLRLWAAGLHVEYDTDRVGGSVDVTGPVLETAVGYYWGASTTEVSFYLGGVYRRVEVDPADANNKIDDDDFGFKTQLEIKHTIDDRFSVSAMGHYTFIFAEWWSRLRPAYRLDEDISVGPEFLEIGGGTYDAQRFGLFVEGVPLGAVKVGADLGAELERGGEMGIYGGAEFSFLF